MSLQVVQRSQTMIDIIDTESGVVKRTANVGDTIVGGPLIAGNTVTVTVQTSSGGRFIKVYDINSLCLKNSIAV